MLTVLEKFFVLFVSVFLIGIVFSYPLAITYDGNYFFYYSKFFSGENISWDFIRTPIYPFLIRVFFFVFGEGAVAILILNTVFLVLGLELLLLAISWKLSVLKKCFLYLIIFLSPFVVSYQHYLLMESGLFFFCALMLWPLVFHGWKRYLLISIFVVISYYFKPTFYHVGFVWLWGVFVLDVFSGGIGNREEKVKLIVLNLVLSILITSGIYLWDKNISSQRKVGVFVGYLLHMGVINQINVSDEYLNDTAFYHGNFPRYGIPPDILNKERYKNPTAKMPGSYFNVLVKTAITEPRLYFKTLIKTYSNYILYPAEGEILLHEKLIFQSCESGDPLFDNSLNNKLFKDDSLRKRLFLGVKCSPLFFAIHKVEGLYRILNVLGWISAFVGVYWSFRCKDMKLLAIMLFPIIYCFAHAVPLMGIDRYGYPVHIMLLVFLMFIFSVIKDKFIKLIFQKNAQIYLARLNLASISSNKNISHN